MNLSYCSSCDDPTTQLFEGGLCRDCWTIENNPIVPIAEEPVGEESPTAIPEANKERLTINISHEPAKHQSHSGNDK